MRQREQQTEAGEENKMYHQHKEPSKKVQHFSLTPALGKGNCLYWCFSGKKAREMSNLTKQAGKRTKKKAKTKAMVITSAAQHFPGKGNDMERHWPENPALETLRACMAEMGTEAGEILQGNKDQRGSKAKTHHVTNHISFLKGRRLIKTELKVSL